MIWSVLHSIDIILWVIIAGSVAYVVFFAIISLFYDKEDHIAAHAAALSNKQCRFLPDLRRQSLYHTSYHV